MDNFNFYLEQIQTINENELLFNTNDLDDAKRILDIIDDEDNLKNIPELDTLLNKWANYKEFHPGWHAQLKNEKGNYKKDKIGSILKKIIKIGEM